MNNEKSLLATTLGIVLAAVPAAAADIVFTPPVAGGLAITNAAGNANRLRVGEDGIVTLPGLGAVPVPSTGLCVEIATGRVGTCAIGTGTVTSVATGTGLTGGPITATGTISIANLGVGTAQLADGAVTAAKIGANGCVGGQVLQYNGATWVCVTPSSASGTVSSVATGTGLTGGPITGSGTISIANLGVDTAQLADRSVTAAKMAANGCGNGQVLQFDGITWVCATPSQQGGNALGAPMVIGTTDNQPVSLIANGVAGLTITPHITSPSLTGGFSGNTVTSGVAAGTIAGGGVPGAFSDPITGINCGTLNDCTNRVTDHAGTVGGGIANQAGDGAGTIFDRPYATVAGGRANLASGYNSTIGGGGQNTASAIRAGVASGGGNTASGDSANIAGGFNNAASGAYSAIGGGQQNTATNAYAWIGAGRENNATGDRSVIAGGGSNNATAFASAVGGGSFNTAGGLYSFVAGGNSNTANGDYSFAGGRGASIDAAHDGSFVWADGNNATFASSAANEFSVRATGGVRFVTNLAGTTGCSIAAGGGSWACSSDEAAKADFAAVDAGAVLAKVAALPIRTWRYREQDPSIRHIGPMAQDFRAAFGVGVNERTITMVDADGVALAAIQGLHRVVEEQGRTIEALQARAARVEALEAQLAAIKRRLGLD